MALIEDGAFRGMSSLKTLDLTINNISEISANTFIGLSN